MTIQECAKHVTENGCSLIRYRKDSLKDTGVAHYDCKDAFTGSKRGWKMLDAMTAGAIIAVYNALNADNQAKFHKIPLSTLIPFCWKHVK